VDNPICVSCHKGLSLEDIERGNFRDIGGRLYCGECVGRMRRVGPMACPQCGTTDTPLYTGTGYQCRKCGAALQPRPQVGKAATPQQPRVRRAVKPCPYCGAAIPAEALKCRYCGSSLTRDAHDADAFGRQNSRLRFWVGCLLSASVFLLLFLFYVLATRGSHASAPQAAAPSTASPAKADGNADLVRELRDELRKVRLQLAALEAEQQRLATAKPPAEPVRPPAPKTTEVSTPKAVPEKEKPKEPTPVPKAAVTPPVPPEPKEKAPAPPEPKKEEPPKAKAVERTAAQLAAAAYPVFATELEKLKAGRRYGDAFTACRQFLAAHLGTPEAEKVQAAQKALRDELDKVREDHALRFKQAIEKGDIEGSRRVIAQLTQYDAPEVREDRDRMLAEIKAAERKPDLDLARYLAQWEAAPNAARLLQDLKNEKDWTVRSRAAKELGRIGHRAAIGPLIEALKDQEFYVKSCAINSLAEIGDPIALPALAPLTKASFPVVYDTAARACATLAAAPRDKFADAWKLVDPKAVAKEIAEALRVQDKEDSPATSRYQTALVEALALLDAKDAAPVIRSLFDKAKDPAVRKTAADAIQKLTGESLAPEPPKEAPKAPEPKAEPPKAPEPKATPAPKAPDTPAPPAKG